VIPVISIDGPTASGKGTVAQRVASALQFHYLDSGALYRITALAALSRGVALDAAAALATLAREIQIRFDGAKILSDGVDVTLAIRQEKVGNAASAIAILPALREALLDRQRAFRRPPGLVADGRDMGTVVFADAPLKIFLVASPEARAKRRTKQLMENGIFANMLTLLQDLSERDARDSQRAVAPLAAAQDAITIDSSDLEVSEVVDRILALARERSIGVRC